MKIRYAAKTDVGMKRTHNEDYFSLIEDEQLFLVADGMGGHASGEVASKMAAETIGEFYQRTREDEDATWPYKMDRSLSYIENRLVCAVKLANLRIFETSNRDLRYKGMGTTIVSTLVSGDKIRSEEHTSELQSRLHLVCRLLLEKKKTTVNAQTARP